jgi:hypothetical protein
MDDFVLLASQGINVRTDYSNFIQPITNITFCFQNNSYLQRTENATFFNVGILYFLSNEIFSSSRKYY